MQSVPAKCGLLDRPRPRAYAIAVKPMRHIRQARRRRRVNAEVVRQRYTDLLGHVPEKIETRLALAQRVRRTDAIIAVDR